jgi:hypothetical protein
MHVMAQFPLPCVYQYGLDLSCVYQYGYVKNRLETNVVHSHGRNHVREYLC